MHQYTVSQCLSRLHTDSHSGLSATMVDKSTASQGTNTLPTKDSVSLVARFASQFCDLMIVILLVSAALSLVLAFVEGEGFAEPFIIVAIVLANAILGTVQQHRADRALSQLASMSAKQAVAIRGGVRVNIDSSQLVVGDIVLLESGCVVPADCRVVYCNALQVDESSLTGEFMPIAKSSEVLPVNTSLADRVNCLYSGSSVLCGNCTAVVFAVGVQTEIGAIASMLSSNPATKTPLENKLKQLSHIIGIACLAVCGLVFVVGLAMGISNMSPADRVVDVFMDIFMTSVSLAVAAIPEGLPAIVTLVLARGVSRMASKNAIIKNLTAVETLGSATVICTDKTGTLTTGQMSLESIVTISGTFNSTNATAYAKSQLGYACMCCDAVIGASSYGDPTEIAILRSAKRLGVSGSGSRVYEMPFDSIRKKMTVVVSVGGKYYAVTKGSLDNMISCDSSADNRYWLQQCNRLASRGLRVLALSVVELDQYFVRDSSIEDSVNITALLVLSDTLRDRVCNSVATCKQAGIRPVMITGDSLACAVSLATTMGIYVAGDSAIEGSELARMSDSELDSRVSCISVYARVTPADKLRIVEAWQRSGAVTAMTGDGVNDSPALHRADIGCAMGKQGTDVAKESADMILVDDNFATIVDAVAEGRTVYNNIKKSVFYLLSCNIGEVLCVLLALVLFNVTPLGAMQLLWVNLVTDGLPSIALGLDNGLGSMDSKPSGQSGFFAEGRGVAIPLYGALIAVITVIAYSMGNCISASSGMTMAFIVLALSQLLFALEVRCNRCLVRDGISLLMAVACMLSLILLAVVVFLPSAQGLFELVALPSGSYWWCVILAFVPTVAYEIVYWAKTFVQSDKQKQKYS